MAPRGRKPARPVAKKRTSDMERWSKSFMNYLRSECHLAENTVAAYGRDLRRFARWLQGRRLATLSIGQLSEYAQWLHEEQLASASIARHIVSLKVFFRYLQLEGALQDNLAELLGSQRLWQRVPNVMSPGTVTEFLAAPRGHDPFPRRDRALLELLYATGCRASELSCLRVRDIHLKDRYCLCHGKGNKQRIVPLGKPAIAAVRTYMEQERGMLAEHANRPPEWLILSRRGRRLRESGSG